MLACSLACLLVCLFVCLFVGSLACLLACLFVRLLVGLFVCLYSQDSLFDSRDLRLQYTVQMPSECVPALGGLRAMIAPWRAGASSHLLPSLTEARIKIPETWMPEARIPLSKSLALSFPKFTTSHSSNLKRIFWCCFEISILSGPILNFPKLRSQFPESQILIS